MSATWHACNTNFCITMRYKKLIITHPVIYAYQISNIMSIKFNIDKMNLVYIQHEKSFDETNNICERCKKSLVCAEAVVVGKCGHAFHQKCMYNVYSCPLDNIAWVTDHTIKEMVEVCHKPVQKLSFPKVMRH